MREYGQRSDLPGPEKIITRHSWRLLSAQPQDKQATMPGMSKQVGMTFRSSRYGQIAELSHTMAAVVS